MSETHESPEPLADEPYAETAGVHAPDPPGPIDREPMERTAAEMQWEAAGLFDNTKR